MSLSEKPSNIVYRLSRQRFNERWEDLPDGRKITILLDLIDDIWDRRFEI